MSSTMKISDDCETKESLTNTVQNAASRGFKRFLTLPRLQRRPTCIRVLRCITPTPNGISGFMHRDFALFIRRHRFKLPASVANTVCWSADRAFAAFTVAAASEADKSRVALIYPIAPIFYQAPDCITSTPKTPTTHSPIGARTGGAPLLAVSTTSIIRSASVLLQLTASKRSSGTNALVSDHTSNSPAEKISRDKLLKPSYFYTPTSLNTASISVYQFPNSAMETQPTPFNLNTAANGFSSLPRPVAWVRGGGPYAKF